jgi:hypothetical protein
VRFLLGPSSLDLVGGGRLRSVGCWTAWDSVAGAVGMRALDPHQGIAP